MTVAYEGYGVASATAGDFVFYGIRQARLHDGYLDVDTGFLAPGMPPTGKTVVTLPSRDNSGQLGTMTITVDILNWKLTVLTGEYKMCSVFTYTGVIDTPAVNKIDFEMADDPSSLVTVVEL